MNDGMLLACSSTCFRTLALGDNILTLSKRLFAIPGTARVDAVTVPTACLSPPRLLVFDGGKDHRERVSNVQVSTEVTDHT